jgi:dinuclear metal center YbgI/SA1388 family protein
MTKTVGSMSALLSTTFNLSKAAAWDAVGLQFGDPDRRVDSVAVCHEVTPLVTDLLVAEPVDLVVTYHPLLFRPTTRLVAGLDPAGRAFRLIASGVSLLVAHTGFDVASGGTADQLAAEIGLSRIEGVGPLWGKDSSKVITFVPRDFADSVTAAMARAGAGSIGNYSSCSYRSEGVGAFLPGSNASPSVGTVGELHQEPEIRIEMLASRGQVDAVVAALAKAHPYEEPAFDVIDSRSNAGFVGRVGELDEKMTLQELGQIVADRLGGVVRIAGSGPVSTVAVIPGAGGSMLDGIVADVVVTGDVSHHQARAALARGMNVIDPGHAATERPGVRALYAAVTNLVGSAKDMTEVDSDPWKGR